MSCTSIECGYLEVGCCGCKVDVFNNTLAQHFLVNALKSCKDENFPGVVPCCTMGRGLGTKTCGLFGDEVTHPGYQDPDTGEFAAWWFDTTCEDLSNGIYGFATISHTLGTTDQFEGNDRDLLRRSVRRYRKGLRVGVIRGAVIAASKAHAQHGIEALRNRFVNGQGDCPCDTTTLGFHRWCCNPDEKSTGYRELHGVGGFSLEIDEDQPNTKCDGICRFTITYEATGQRTYASEQAHKCEIEFGPCVPYAGCDVEILTEVVDVETRTPRQAKSISLLYDQATGEKIACPIDFEWVDYDPATCQLFVVDLGSQAAEAVECKPYRVRLIEDTDGGITWEKINASRWPADGSIPCDCDVIVAEIVAPNPNYDPTCPDCPQFARSCADEYGFTVDTDGFISDAPVGTHTWTPTGGWSSQAAEDWHDYLLCVGMAESVEDVFNNSGPDGFGQFATSMNMNVHSVGSVTRLVALGGAFGGTDCTGPWFRWMLDLPGMDWPQGDPPPTSITNCQPESEYISTGPNPMLPEGATVACGASEPGPTCFPEITRVLNTLPTGDQECYFAELDPATGAVVPDGWSTLADIEYGAVVIRTPDCPPDSVQSLLEQCPPPIPSDACVDIQIVDAATNHATWSETNFTVGALFPYTYQASQFEVCQDTDPIITVTPTEVPVASADGCAPKGLNTLELPGLPPSAWDQLEAPTEERRGACDFGAWSCNVQHAGSVMVANNSSDDMNRIELLWFTTNDATAPDPVTDWDYWKCRIPAAITRIPCLPANTAVTVDDCSTDVLCGRKWVTTRGLLDSESCPPLFLGAEKVYLVARVPCDGELPVVAATLTPVDTL